MPSPAPALCAPAARTIDRLEQHKNATTLPYATAAQRARLAALNALAIATPGPWGGEVAALFPAVPDRRLTPDGRPDGVITAATLGRDAAVCAAAIELAEAELRQGGGEDQVGGRVEGEGLRIGEGGSAEGDSLVWFCLAGESGSVVVSRTPHFFCFVFVLFSRRLGSIPR